MKIRTIGYYITESVKGLIRNTLMSVTSTVTVAACALIVVFSILLTSDIEYSLSELDKSVGVSAIIDDNLPASRLDALKTAITDIPYVAYVEYVSAEDALLEFSQTLGDDALLAGLKNDNPLPRSFNIGLTGSEHAGDVIGALKSERLSALGVAKVREAKDVTDVLAAFCNMIRIAGIIIVSILGMLSVVIVMNTIKLTVNTRRTEIGIMKFIGATDTFIKTPFVLEGLIIGLIGSAVPAVLCFIGYDALINVLKEKYRIIGEMFVFRDTGEIFVPVVIITVIIGACIGMLGSMSSVRKYLDV